MLDYTCGMIHKTIGDIRKLLFTINVLSLLVYVLYLFYAIITRNGIIWVNLPLLCVVISYFIFYIVKHEDIDDDSKKLKKKVKRFYRWSKIAIKAISFGITILGLYTSTISPDFITILMTAITAIILVFSLLGEIVIAFINKRIDLFKEAFQMDMQKLNPVNAVRNMIDSVNGAAQQPTKSQSFIQKWAENAKAKRAADTAIKRATKKHK